MREPSKDSGPLSFQQAEMAGRMTAHPECAPWYDEVRVFELTGPLDVPALEAAVLDLAARHGVLRTTIRADRSSFVQDRDDHLPTEFEQATVTADGTRLAAELGRARLGAEEALSGDPLFRPSLHRAGDERHLLVLRIHHLLFDGMSFAVLWRDLGELYSARRERRPPELPELGPEYIDFARKQHASWPQARGEAVWFWDSVTAGATGEVEWPRPRVDGGDPYRHDVTRFALSPAAAGAVAAGARRNRVSPFLVLLSATAGAVAAVSRCRDPLLGTDVANRRAPGSHDLVGHFLSSRLTRFVEPQNRGVDELVAEAREPWFEAEAHEEPYIGEVLKELGVGGFTPVQLELPTEGTAPRLEGVRVLPIEVPPWPHYWRDAWIIWSLADGTCECLLTTRRSRVAEWVPKELAREIAARLEDGGS